MKKFLYKIIKPHSNLEPLMHYQMCIVNSMSLFTTVLMIAITGYVLNHREFYSENGGIDYLVLHNFVVSGVFALAFLLGKSKNYFQAGLVVFHLNFFLGCVLTILNVGTPVIYNDVYPYLCIQLLVASFFYTNRELFVHTVVLLFSFVGMYLIMPVLTSKELTQSTLLLATFSGLAYVSVNLRARVIDQFQQERLTSRLNTLHEVNSGISHNVNNPLAIISSANELVRIELTKVDPDKKKILELIEKSEATTARISQTIKSLNTFSESEKRKFNTKSNA